MRTFPPPAGTRFYAGVDLHARALFLVVLDADGQVRFGRNLPAAPYEGPAPCFPPEPRCCRTQMHRT